MKLSYWQYKEKSYKGTPQVYFDYIYRAISHPLTYILLRFGVTPNQMTITSIVLAIVAGAVIMLGFPVYGLLVFMFSYLLDFCDGNAARVIIKTQGMSEIDKKRGNILENLNTNLALLAMYGSVGYHLSQTLGDERLFILAFLIFGVKMVSRYTVRQAYDVFRDLGQSLAPGQAFMDRYAGSGIVKIKFFLAKSFFAANFYYVIYLVSFLILGNNTWVVLIVYGSLDGLVSSARAGKALFRHYA